MSAMDSTLPPTIQALLNPRAYPEPAREVELVQTQISFVLLAGDYVYKVKKPVNFGFLDFSTLEKRRFYCQREVKLNRRLCPDIYLGIVDIVEREGGYALGGPGRVVEHAVKMRRLPQDRMMNELLQRGQVTPEMVARVARRLAGFHQEAETNPEISRIGGLEAVRHNTEENFAQTEKYVGLCLSPRDYRAIMEYTRGFLKREEPLLRRRAWEGRIRDCHGDAHSANICITDGIYIYDCIEFNDSYRYGDVAEEVAFLAMDLDYYGHPELSLALVEAYISASGDGELPRLLDFFKCYRAYVRGKVASLELDDPYIPPQEKERVLGVARCYFGLARSYVCLPPALLITAGLIGTGKSLLAQELGRRTGAAVLSSDVVRKRLAGLEPAQRRAEPFGQGIYSPAFTRKTYQALLREASQLLRAGKSVIIDASFRKAEERRRALALACKTGADLWILECRAPEALIQERLERRAQEEGVASDARWDLFPQIKADFEPVAEVPPERHLALDTSGPVAEVAAQVEERIPQLGGA